MAKLYAKPELNSPIEIDGEGPVLERPEGMTKERLYRAISELNGGMLFIDPDEQLLLRSDGSFYMRTELMQEWGQWTEFFQTFKEEVDLVNYLRRNPETAAKLTQLLTLRGAVFQAISTEKRLMLRADSFGSNLDRAVERINEILEPLRSEIQTLLIGVKRLLIPGAGGRNTFSISSDGSLLSMGGTRVHIPLTPLVVRREDEKILEVHAGTPIHFEAGDRMAVMGQLRDSTSVPFMVLSNSPDHLLPTDPNLKQKVDKLRERLKFFT